MEELLTRIETSFPAGFEGLTKISRTGRDLSFSDILKIRLEQESGITFSAHAMDRLGQRGIVLTSEELSQLSDAVSLADGKGAEDTLVVMNDKAFIVSVKNNTVVTAMTGENIKDNVFTNIDSTVIV
ncbi:TIGR02530 family flagellar biosynthesis protein [Candidatus Latescibacterota bacterium]